MPTVRVARVLPCRCEAADHALALLRTVDGGWGVKVRIDGDVARALLAQLGGLPSALAGVVDLLGESMRALDAGIEAITLGCAGERLSAQLRLRTAAGSVEIGVDPSQAVFAACRLGLPIQVSEPEAHSGEVPAVYRPFLDTLDMDGLDAPDPPA